MYSVQIAVSDGTLTRISLSIEYFEKSDITLYRNLELTPLVLGVDWQWDGDTAINLLTGTPVPAGDYITVRRNTNIKRAYNIYDGGASFSRETLDENFKQMIYLAQEFTEGNGLTGLFFPLDMHGFKITNLGPGQNPTDAINKGQLDAEVQRIAALENTYVASTNSYPWHMKSTVETDTFTPPYVFSKAALYLDGACQTPDYSYIVVDNTIITADPVPAGTIVFARLGEDVPTEQGTVSVEQFTSVVTALEAADTGLGQDITDLEGDLTALAGTVTAQGTSIGNRAMKGVNTDITRLDGLTDGIKGRASATGVATGYVGESPAVATGTDVALTSGADVTISTLTLSAGTWLLQAQLSVQAGAGAVVTKVAVGANNAASMPDWRYASRMEATQAAAGNVTQATPMRIVSQSAATTWRVMANVTFSGGTCTARGAIIATRIA